MKETNIKKGDLLEILSKGKVRLGIVINVYIAKKKCFNGKMRMDMYVQNCGIKKNLSVSFFEEMIKKGERKHYPKRNV